ncbi:MAG: CBS domain-containing protein [Desulfuromonadales bacterium]|nr:CBS domain-containing protein [Desulfuromonadales bacterium]
MKARDIMNTDFSVVSAKAPVVEAFKVLKSNFDSKRNANSAPGLIAQNEKGELAGVLSPLGLLRAFTSFASEMPRPDKLTPKFYKELCDSLRNKKVEDIMDWQSIFVTADAELLDIAALFVQNRFHRIPVVEDKHVVGVIYRSNLLFALAADLA